MRISVEYRNCDVEICIQRPQYYGGPPPGTGPAAGGMQVHPPPPSNPPAGPQGPTNFLHGPAPWNPAQRTINLGGWKISPAYSRDEYDA